jgi:hypothetical protein
MNWLAIELALTAPIFAVALWLLSRPPTGKRIVRSARRYLRAHPQATEGELREVLRQKYLGGLPPLLGGAAAGLAEGVRDRWFPLDRDAITRRIEAAIQIAFATDPVDASKGRQRRRSASRLTKR